MWGIQEILKKDWNYIIKAKVLNLLEEDGGKSYTPKNMLQKKKQ